MAFMTGNPALRRMERNNVFFAPSAKTATYSGIISKSFYFVILTIVSAMASFWLSIQILENYYFHILSATLGIATIASLVCALLSVFIPKITKYTGSIYAIAQGFVMGFVATIFYFSGFSGIIFAALFATVITFVVMLALYTSRIVRVTNGFKRFVLTAVLSMIILNLFMWIASLFSNTLYVLFYGQGVLSIVISGVMVLLASLMLLVDFNRIEQIVTRGLGKEYEWMASFGLLATLIWLYMEFLRLFLKVMSKRR